MSDRPDTPVTRYASSVVVLHWLIALMIIAMIPMGKSLASLPPGPDKLWLMKLHASVGTLILVLSLTRLVLHVRSAKPSAAADWPGWMTVSSKVMHWALIVVSLLLLVSGLSSFAGFGFLDLVRADQWQPWPDGDAIPPLNAHRALVNALLFLLALHVGAALYHQFLRKDRLFARMWFGSKQEA
jgi:cytochrome b561